MINCSGPVCFRRITHNLPNRKKLLDRLGNYMRQTKLMAVIRRYLSNLLNEHACDKYHDTFSYTLPSGFVE